MEERHDTNVFWGLYEETMKDLQREGERAYWLIYSYLSIMLKAIGDYILVEELDYKERTTKSWFVLQEKKKNETWKGKIVGLWSESQDLEVGDIIYFNRYIPHEVEVDGERYLSMPWKDVQCKET